MKFSKLLFMKYLLPAIACNSLANLNIHTHLMKLRTENRQKIKKNRIYINKRIKKTLRNVIFCKSLKYFFLIIITCNKRNCAKNAINQILSLLLFPLKIEENHFEKLISFMLLFCEIY